MHFSISENTNGVASFAWASPTTIFENVYLSLNIAQGTLFTDPNFGLNLRDIKTVSEQNIEIIHDRIIGALNWMLTTEKARAIKVLCERDNLEYNRVNCKIEVWQNDSQPIIINNFIRVGV